jgi:hypothetical protein
MSTLASAEIAAQNTFTSAKQLQGNFNVSISGTFAATVTVQRSPDNSSWFDVNSVTAPIETTGFEPELMWYRIGVKTGEYTSGTAAVRLGLDDQVAASLRLDGLNG